MVRILVLNNYPLDEYWELVKRKQFPDHYLYGINYFQKKGYEIEIIPFEKSQFLQKLQNILAKSAFPIPLGDLDQQWSTLRYLNQADIIYSPCNTQTHLLSYLRSLGLIKVPIVYLAHHLFNVGRLAKIRKPFFQLLVTGTDAIPCLSSEVAKEINEQGKNIQKAQTVLWGPDINFYPKTSILGEGVVAFGRTGRDFSTFGMAASQTNSQAKIICLESCVLDKFREFGQNVEVKTQSDNFEDWFSYTDLLEIYKKARVLAIPLYTAKTYNVKTNITGPIGLSGLMDALGLGKPVIMTKNPFIDIDIEKEGIGKWVESGNVKGWREAIEFFEDHPDEALEMGKRARTLVEKGLNSESFANQIMKIFENLL